MARIRLALEGLGNVLGNEKFGDVFGGVLPPDAIREVQEFLVGAQLNRATIKYISPLAPAPAGVSTSTSSSTSSESTWKFSWIGKTESIERDERRGMMWQVDQMLLELDARAGSSGDPVRGEPDLELYVDSLSHGLLSHHH